MFLFCRINTVEVMIHTYLQENRAYNFESQLILTHYFNTNTCERSPLWDDPDATEKTLMIVWEITPHPPPRCFLPVSVMDIMGLLRANRSPYLYSVFALCQKLLKKITHSQTDIQNVRAAHNRVRPWNIKLWILPSNILAPSSLQERWAVLVQSRYM